MLITLLLKKTDINNVIVEKNEVILLKRADFIFFAQINII